MNQVRSAVHRILAASAALTCVVMLGSTGVLFAQQDRATIEGLVTDNSGATVPDAKVSVVRVQTNGAIVLKPNGDGRFFAPNLPIGTYNVTVTKAGFETSEPKNLILQSQMS